MWPKCVRQPSCRPTQCGGEARADDWGGPATGGMAGRGPAEGPRRAADLDRFNYVRARKHTRQTMQLRLAHGVIVMSTLPRRDPHTWSSAARPIRVGLPSVPGAGTEMVGRGLGRRPVLSSAPGTSMCPPRLLTPPRHRRTSSREKLSCPLRQGSRVGHRPHRPAFMCRPPQPLPGTLRTWRRWLPGRRIVGGGAFEAFKVVTVEQQGGRWVAGRVTDHSGGQSGRYAQPAGGAEGSAVKHQDMAVVQEAIHGGRSSTGYDGDGRDAGEGEDVERRSVRAVIQVGEIRLPAARASTGRIELRA